MGFPFTSVSWKDMLRCTNGLSTNQRGANNIRFIFNDATLCIFLIFRLVCIGSIHDAASMSANVIAMPSVYEIFWMWITFLDTARKFFHFLI